MSESNNKIPKKSSAKKTFVGLTIFAMICIAITYACIYMTLKTRKQEQNKMINQEEISSNDTSDTKVKTNHIPLKLTDKSHINGIIENKEKESYGEIVDYYEYSGETVRKLEIDYIQIEGLKDKKVQDKINSAIKNKIQEIKERQVTKLTDKDIDRISVSAYIMGNFADVISVYFDEYLHYDFNDEDYENDQYENDIYGLNFSLATGEQIKFNDMFWEDSPIKTILSQSIYKEIAWEYAFAEEDWEWDWNMDNLDYSGIESKVYRFMYQYNQNPDINFYFTPSNIEVCYGKGYDTYTINMADFYEYIAIYTKYKASENLYENSSNLTEFYVFANNIGDENYLKEIGEKANNIYYVLYCYDNPENMTVEEIKALDSGAKAIDKKINEYVQLLKADKEHGYIIESFYNYSEYEEKNGYSFDIEISSCSKKYYDEHLEDALAAGAREPRVDIAPINYAYVDEEHFEFYENYMEWMKDYTDEGTKESNTYTREERLADEERWAREDDNEFESNLILENEVQDFEIRN